MSDKKFLQPICEDCPNLAYDEELMPVCDLSALPVGLNHTCSLWEFLCNYANKVIRLEEGIDDE